jgi:hypothetical protein
MSITATPGATFEATVNNAATGLVGTITVRIEDGQNNIVTAATTAGIVETATGVYTATLAAPVPVGQYVVVWSRGSGAEVGEDLTVSTTGTAPTGGDLCTLADVRRLLQKKTVDTSQDALIGTLITAASVAIMGKLEREFAPATTGVTRTFEWRWEGEFLSLAPYDLRVATAVVVDTDQASPITLSNDEWRYWPQPARDGTYMALRLRPFSAALGRNMWGNRQVQITGNWGFATVHPDVNMACAITVVHWLTVNAAAFRRPDDNPDGYAPPKRGIPPEAWDLLGRFKRAGVA